jgi:hypothetical protein
LALLIHGAASLPLPWRFAYSEAAFEIVNNAAQMTDQLCFLGEDHRDELLVISTAAAAPARRQWSERSHIATAELAPQPLDAANTQRLAAQVAARILKPVAPRACNFVAQIQITALSPAGWALPPWPANARHWLVPGHRNASFVDPNIGRLGRSRPE